MTRRHHFPLGVMQRHMPLPIILRERLIERLEPRLIPGKCGRLGKWLTRNRLHFLAWQFGNRVRRR